MSIETWEVFHPPSGNLIADFDTEAEAVAYVAEIGDSALTVTKRFYPGWCDVCHRPIFKEAHGGIPPSAGDHDPAYHVAKAYGTEVPA